MKLLPVFGRYLKFHGEGITSEGWRGATKMLTFENVGIALEILSLGGIEPEIHMGVIYPPPPIGTL